MANNRGLVWWGLPQATNSHLPPSLLFSLLTLSKTLSGDSVRNKRAIEAEKSK